MATIINTSATKQATTIPATAPMLRHVPVVGLVNEAQRRIRKMHFDH